MTDKDCNSTEPRGRHDEARKGDAEKASERAEDRLANVLERLALKLQQWSNWLFGFLR